MSLDQVEEQIQKYRKELISFLKDCYDFQNRDDIGEILKDLSAFSARASLIRSLIIRSNHPKFNRFRIDELDPFLVEVDRQFKIWSRVSSVEQFEWDKIKG